MFGQNYTIAVIQCRCNLVPATAFAAFHFQLFAFPYAFQFEQGDRHSPSSQTSAGQYSSEKIQLLSRRLLDLICFGGTFFSFELGLKINRFTTLGIFVIVREGPKSRLYDPALPPPLQLKRCLPLYKVI